MPSPASGQSTLSGCDRRTPSTFGFVAARAELDIHTAQDQDDRAQAARRARQQLNEAEQLFGTRLTAIPGTGTARR